MDKAGLHKLLNLEVNSASPTFILYSEKITTRLNYVSKFIFEHVLKVKVISANTLSEFENSDLFKINYSKQPISNSFQIIPQALLFETGITEINPIAALKNNLIYFFENKTKEPANLNYDIFASVFYFISRYEEWQAFEPDIYGRFEAKASILFQNKMHLKPVVDNWIMELKNELENFFSEIKFPQNTFKVISTIDVDNLYAYKAKGFVRTIGAIFKDILKCDLSNLKNRINVLSKKTEDPFDIYSSVSDLCLNKKIPLIYFFLFRSGTKYDRTVDPNSNAFVDVFKRIKERSAFIGLHPSYNTSVEKNLIVPERKKLAQKTEQTIMLSRQHYLRFNIRTTPWMLMENGLDADFTMGFASTPGFRAGTSFPFYYYDFNRERSLQLLFIPFCAMDGAYFVYDKISPEKMLNSLIDLAKEVQKVNGLFVSVFHERTFSSHLYPSYYRIYNNFHQTINEL